MKKKNKIILMISLSLVLLLGSSYALIKKDNYKIKSEDLKVKLQENKSNQNKTINVRPMVNETQESYKETILNGADPVLTEKLIPVTIANNGTVTKADIKKKWYSYANREWANAVILVDTPSKEYQVGEVISESDIESYFVWIPRFKYRLWNVDNNNFYTLSQITDDANTLTSFRKMFGNTRLIDIVFESKTTDKSTGATNGTYLTHPAFTLGEKNLSGIWVGKFETGYNQGEVGKPITDTSSWTKAGAQKDEEASDKVIIKPNVYSWRNSTVSNFFKTAYNYERTLDSHMMKNIEWGAVAYLSHSLYGIGTEIRINNNSDYKTGYSAAVGTDQSSFAGESGNTDNLTQPYNSITGYRASSTGNITGVYDMSGGAHEYMASYRLNSTDKSGFSSDELTQYATYLDTYPADSTTTSYSKRILGDATGEMGPFYQYADKDNNKRYHNAWYADTSKFVDSAIPWFSRGGYFYGGVLAGRFNFFGDAGARNDGIGARLVLATD